MNLRTVQMVRTVLLLIAMVLVVTASARAQDAGALFKAKCSACHAPDGSGSGTMGKNLKTPDLRSDEAQNAICFKCHTEKEGPFVFEHPPVKIEGCQSCHLPHGGANVHMLRVSNVNLLCLQCHTNSSFSGATNTPSFHNQQTYFQACTQCHLQIHGSNFDPTFFK